MVKKILAVDDEEDVLYTIKHGLEELDSNFKVMTAISGEKCLEFLRNGQIPDVILLDIMMPDMSGWDILQIIKSKNEWSSIPVIFLTARTDHVAKSAGGFLADDYIEKPFEMEFLKNRIDIILNEKVEIVGKT